MNQLRARGITIHYCFYFKEEKSMTVIIIIPKCHPPGGLLINSKQPGALRVTMFTVSTGHSDNKSER